MWITRHKTLATAIATFFLAFILLLIAVIPMYRNASTLLKKVSTKTAELDAMNEKVSILSQLDQNVLADRVKVIDSALPPKKDILLYLNAIEGLSRELGLTFGGLSLSPGEITEASKSAATAPAAKKKVVAKTAGGLDSLDTEIKMAGGEDSVYAFLRTIEEVLPLMQIKDIKVSILPGNQYSLSLTLGMLWAESSSASVKGPITLFNSEEDRYFTLLSGYRTFGSAVLLEGEPDTKQDLFAPFSALPATVNVIESIPETETSTLSAETE